MKIQFMDLKVQYRALKEEIDQAIGRVIDAARFIQGEEVRLLEQEFASYCGVQYAIGASSGTTALHLALLCCGVTSGDEVITVPHTFIATVEAISHCGAYPVFIDVNQFSYNIDVEKLEHFLKEDCFYDERQGGLKNRHSGRRIKAIIPVHLYGRPADMEPIMELARRHNLQVVEDAAQAHGAKYRGQRVGSFGDVACFSFYPGKNLGAYGDAGIAVTNSPVLAGKMRKLSDHGREDKYQHLEVGYNYRLDTIQAAVLRVKLKHLDTWNDLRRQNANSYFRQLQDTPLALPKEQPGTRHVYHLYVVRTPQRDRLKNHLTANRIATGIHYPIPLHLQPAYGFLGYRTGDFPVSEMCADQVLSLPMYPELPEVEIENVAKTIKGWDE